MDRYTIFDHGHIRRGDARSLLEEVRAAASTRNAEIARMSTEEYADALIEDAPFFLDDDLLLAMNKNVQWATKFDQALTYLAQMPTSGLRILTVKAA